MLSGEGADELFGGYLTYRANRFATLRARSRPLRCAWLRWPRAPGLFRTKRSASNTR